MGLLATSLSCCGSIASHLPPNAQSLRSAAGESRKTGPSVLMSVLPFPVCVSQHYRTSSVCGLAHSCGLRSTREGRTRSLGLSTDFLAPPLFLRVSLCSYGWPGTINKVTGIHLSPLPLPLCTSASQPLCLSASAPLPCWD